MAKVAVGGEDSTSPPAGPSPIEALTKASMAGNVLLLFIRGNW